MASNKLKLEGKVAIITGGLFSSNGAAVIIADINDSLGQLVADSISPPGRCTFFHCDVREELHLAAVDHAITTYGRLDIMFSNAVVVGTTRGILDFDPADLDYVLAVHVRGTALAIKQAGRAMVAACKAYGVDAGKVEEMSCAAANLKGKVLRTDDVAAAVLFLASDESGFISEHNVVIDGGVTVVNTTAPRVWKE